MQIGIRLDSLEVLKREAFSMPHNHEEQPPGTAGKNLGET